MQLIYDGLHQMHLTFDETIDICGDEHPGQEWLFDNKDTDQLAMFLYPRACAIVANQKLALDRRYLDEKLQRDKMRQEIENGLTSRGTSEDK